MKEKKECVLRVTPSTKKLLMETCVRFFLDNNPNYNKLSMIDQEFMVKRLCYYYLNEDSPPEEQQ